MHELSQPCKQVLLKAEFAYLACFCIITVELLGGDCNEKPRLGTGRVASLAHLETIRKEVEAGWTMQPSMTPTVRSWAPLTASSSAMCAIRMAMLRPKLLFLSAAFQTVLERHRFLGSLRPQDSTDDILRPVRYGEFARTAALACLGSTEGHN